VSIMQEKDDLMIELGRRVDRVSELEGELEKSAAGMESVQTYLEEANGKCTSLMESKSQMEEELRSRNESIELFTMELKNMSNENHRLEELAAHSKETISKTITLLESQLIALQTSLSQKDEELVLLNQNSSDRIKEVERMLSLKTDECLQLSGKAESTAALVEETREAHLQKVGQLDRSVGKLEKLLRTSEETTRRLSEQRTRLAAEVRENQIHLQEAKAEIATLRANLSDAGAKHNLTLQEKEGLMVELDEAKQNASSHAARVRELTVELDDSGAGMESVKAHLEEANSKCTSLMESKSHLEEELRIRNESMESLTMGLTESKDAISSALARVGVLEQPSPNPRP